MMTRTVHTEVLVIGSGFGAAAPAFRLSQEGLEVLMIEKGPDVVPERDFRQTQDPKYLLQYIKSVSAKKIRLTYAEGLGGGSGFYEMVSLRAPSIAFEQRNADGSMLWPTDVDREVLNPYYRLAEEMMRVTQIGREEIPKTGVAFSLLMKNLGYSVDRVPYSVRRCVGSSYCVAGCVSGAKQTLHSTYLDPARRAGMRILTGAEALEIRPLDLNGENAVESLSGMPHRYEVRCRMGEQSEPLLIRAKLVILGGGAVGTARLLLNSRKSLPRLSDQLGKNVAVNGTVKALGLLPPDFPEGDMFTGRSHPGVISYQFLKSMGITISTAKPLPVDVISSAHIVLEGEQRKPSWWGQPHVEFMKQLRRRAIVIYALGLTGTTGELRLSRSGQVRPAFTLDEEFRAYYKRTTGLLHSILKRNGARVAHPRFINGEGNEYDDLHVMTAHMTGSCRMAESERNGVVDAQGEVFGHPGLYVADGAAIPGALAVNPYLTILANAERIASHLVRRFVGRRPSRERRLADTPAEVREVA
jgi:choline dehydrogenase-like flavoprotein